MPAVIAGWTPGLKPRLPKENEFSRKRLSSELRKTKIGQLLNEIIPGKQKVQNLEDAASIERMSSRRQI
jgi:hypothetical protein